MEKEFSNPYVISKGVREQSAYYTVAWSPLACADKYNIARTVPSIGGIAQFYYNDKYKKLNLFCLQKSWFGGLRSMIRERTDPVLEKDSTRLGILEEYKDNIFYRWTASDSMSDMTDVIFFLAQTLSLSIEVESSGRYDFIYLKEIDFDRIVTT